MTKTSQFIAALIVTLMSACSEHDAIAPGQTLHRGLGGEPASLDPTKAEDDFSQEVLRDLYEGLIAELPNGAASPGAAVSWTINSDGTRYIFRLREARWSNGERVRAQDFVDSWRRVVDPTRASPAAEDLRVIKHASEILAGKLPTERLGVYAASDDLLVVELERPASYFLQILMHPATYPIYSRANPSSHHAVDWVSNGPYVLDSWAPGSTIKLIRNKNYWDKRKLSVESVEYQIAPDANAQFARYRAGQLDLTDTVPANAIPTIKQTRPNELLTSPYLAISYYALNLSGPNAKSVKLREALAMAIDRQKLVTLLAFGQTPAFGFVPPGTLSYQPQSFYWKDLNETERVAESKRLLAEARISDLSKIHLRLLFNENPAIRNAAVIIAGMWKQTLKIDTKLIEQEYRVFLETRHDKSQWDVARLGWVADYNDAESFLQIFKSDSINNDSGYHNFLYDKLLEEASREVNVEKREGLLESCEKLLLSDYPVIPLYFFVSNRLVKPYVHGLEPNPLNHVGSRFLSMDVH